MVCTRGRGLAEATEENTRFCWLLGGEKPDFWTICEFREQFAPQLGDLLEQTIEIGVREGANRPDRVAIDGTIIRASTGGGSFRGRESLEHELDRAQKGGRRLKRASTTDPESRFVERRGGRNAAYNVQAAVDIESGIVVGAHVTTDVSDGARLKPMLEQIEKNTHRNPQTVLADRGYYGVEGLEALDDRGFDGRVR